MNRQHGFSLIELIIVSVILMLLAITAFPYFQNALIRAHTAKINSDFHLIKNSLEMYRTDHRMYPWQHGIVNLRLIDEVFELTTPVAYLEQIPQNPFLGKIAEVEVDPFFYPTGFTRHQNYYLGVRNFITDRKIFDEDTPPSWSISSGGPISFGTHRSATRWYSSTNGIRSFGGFWMDSTGLSTFNDYNH